MTERTFSHLNKTVGNKSNSLRTVIPHSIVEKMELTDSDMLEWVMVNKRESIIKKLWCKMTKDIIEDAKIMAIPPELRELT